MLWGKDIEDILRLISKDKKLSEIVVEAIIGQIDARKCRRKIIRRISYLKVRDIFTRKTSDELS